MRPYPLLLLVAVFTGARIDPIGTWTGTSVDAGGPAVTVPYPTLNGDVMALATDGNLVYAGGYFTMAGADTLNRIGMWDGTRWRSLGSGANGAVYALTVGRNGELYAGGAFTTMGGVRARYIAVWDGFAWSEVGGGMNLFVQSLGVTSDGTLYAGGAFTRADTVRADYIARWDGTRWHRLGTGKEEEDMGPMDMPPYTWGTNHNVMALAVGADDMVYAAGGFSTAGGMPAYQIARWDGEHWSELGTGMNDPILGRPVMALAIGPDGVLYAGGLFQSAGSVRARYLARWDGARWSAVPGGVNGTVVALAVDGKGVLYVGGYFTRAGSLEAEHLAVWDGRRWSSPGGGTPMLVNALAVDEDDEIHIGAGDTRSGAPSEAYFSCLTKSTGSGAQPPAPANEGKRLVSTYPNPFSESTTIVFSLPTASRVNLRVYDALGREVSPLVQGFLSPGDHRFEWRGSARPSGLYLYTLEVNGRMQTGSLVLRR